MPKRKLDDVVSEETSCKTHQVAVTASSQLNTNLETKSEKPRRQNRAATEVVKNCQDNCLESVPCSKCSVNDLKKCSATSSLEEDDHTYNSFIGKDVNNHNNVNVNTESTDMSDINQPSGSCDSTATLENTVSELTVILSSTDKDITNTKSKAEQSQSVRKVLKPILKVRTSTNTLNCVTSTTVCRNNFNSIGCVVSDSQSKGSSAMDITSGSPSTSNCQCCPNSVDLGQSSMVRDSLESNVESLSDKEIENDNVFESSNDMIDASPDVTRLEQNATESPECSQNSTELSTPLKGSSTMKGRRQSTECEESPDLEPPRKRKKTVHFDNVKVYYFPRKQGFTCVPSQGGSTLGMAESHVEQEDFSITQHAKLQRQLHKHILIEQHKQGKIVIPAPKLQQLQDSHQRDEEALRMSATSSQSSTQDEDDTDKEAQFSTEESDSEDDLQVDDYYFLQPVPTRQRRIMLRQSGVKKIDTVEKDMCKDIRVSREVCGCDCKGYCDPATCICSLAGIKCQVDRPSFPCGCTKDGCRNPEGRVEFNPIRVRTHFIHTLMRLENEQKMEQRKRAIAIAKRRRHLKFLENAGGASTETESKDLEDTVNNSDDNDEDMSLYNSNEMGSCRDCQTSDVSNFLLRQRQQHQLQQQQQQQQDMTSQQTVYDNTTAPAVNSCNDPPSCMGSTGIQQAYMTALDESAQMVGGDTDVGNIDNEGQLYVNGEDYIAENTTDMFGFAQEESSYSESSEDCSSIGSNPDAEVTVGGNNNNRGSIYSSAAAGSYTGPQTQVTSTLASQQYDPSLVTVASHQSTCNDNQGIINDSLVSAVPQMIVSSNGIQQISHNTTPSYIPANNNYHQLQPSTAEAEQKYMDINGTGAASFKLEPISEILNPIRFSGGPPQFQGFQEWNSSFNGGGSTLTNLFQGTNSQNQEGSNHPPLLNANNTHGSMDSNVCTVQQQYNTLSDDTVINAKSFTANSLQQQSVQQVSANGTMFHTQKQRQQQLQNGEVSVKNHGDLNSPTVNSIAIGHNISTSDHYNYSHDIIYTTNSVEGNGNMSLSKQEMNLNTSHCNNEGSVSPNGSSTVGQHCNGINGTVIPINNYADKPAANVKQLPKVTTNSITSGEVKLYHELKTSSCHSASEAVYASEKDDTHLPLLENSGKNSNVNLSLSQESHLHALSVSSSTQKCEQETKSLHGLCVSSSTSTTQREEDEPDSTTSSSYNKCSMHKLQGNNPCIQGLGALVNSVAAVTTTELTGLGDVPREDLTDSVCPNTDVVPQTQANEDIPSSTTSTSSATATTTEDAEGVACGNQAEVKSDGTSTDDSEDSGLGSMTEDQTTTQNFGEIIKKSIVETVSA